MKKIILSVLIPLIIIILALVGVAAYFIMNNTPENAFKTAVTKSLEMAKKGKKNIYSIKSNAKMTASIESDKAEIKEINEVLKTSALTYGTEMDLKNEVFFNSLNVLYDNKQLVDLEVFLQDNKAYLNLKDLFNKYIIIEEDTHMSESLEEIRKSESIDTELMIEAIKQELLNEILKQNLMQEKTTININGQSVKVTKNYFELDDDQQLLFIKELLESLKNNVYFQNAFGEYKDEFLTQFDSLIQSIDMGDSYAYQYAKSVKSTKICYSVYSKGLFNNLVAADIVVKENDVTTYGVNLSNYNNIMELSAYNSDGNNKNYVFKITNEKDKRFNEGALNVSVWIDNTEHIVTCKYVKNENSLSFHANTNEEKNNVSVSGSIKQENNTYNGSVIVDYNDIENGDIKIQIDVVTVINEESQKRDVSNATALEEITGEEKEKLLSKFEESDLYKFLEENNALGMLEMAGNTLNAFNTKNEYIENDKYKISYNVPSEWTKEGITFNGQRKIIQQE